VPIPQEAAIPRELVDQAIESATEHGGTGAGVTPRVLAAIASATEGRTVDANIVLAAHNAHVAALIAGSLVT
jgi:pseudouridine-5'-phosphate glycosidase